MEYVYGALLLHRTGQAITEENLKKVVAATGIQVDEVKVKVLVASLKDVDIEKELETARIATASPVATEGTAEAGEGEAKEKAKEKASEAAEGLSSLFG